MNQVAYIFWQDQAEYYFVCAQCYEIHKHEQWSGSTKVPNWKEHRQQVNDELNRRISKGDICEWCSK